MSEDSKDSPPAKLTLSRDLKTKAESNASSGSTANADPVKAPPVMKLRRMSEMTQATDAATPAGATSSSEAPKASPESVDTPQQAKPSFDPKNPFGGKIKDNEIKEPISQPTELPSSPPPELPQSPKPMMDAQSGAMVEEAINSLNTAEEQNASKNSILPSVIIILILLLVLGGAGFGLWKILKTSDESNDNAEIATSSAPSKSGAEKPNNPIEKAKTAIAEVPVADVDAITNTTPAAIEDSAPASTSPPPAPTAAPSSIESDKQAASEFLSNIHIGGLRKGDRPMIILDGERFNVGDIVHAETGLKFDGLRDGRLAFRDQNGIVYLKSF